MSKPRGHIWIESHPVKDRAKLLDHIKYLYSGNQPAAAMRLRGLEAIEDEHTTSLLEDMTDLDGYACLEVGAGAGSIANWLANRVGSSGSVTATDIESSHLEGSNFDVLKHDIEKDYLPNRTYDLVHFRHVLIHLADPTRALQRMFASMKPGAFLLGEESDLSTWRADDSMPKSTYAAFQSGINAIFEVYRSHDMDIRTGSELKTLLTDVGFTISGQSEQKRHVSGGSAEAIYQSASAKRLAGSLDKDNEHLRPIRRLAECLLDPQLRYQSRTTVSVSAQRPKESDIDM